MAILRKKVKYPKSEEFISELETFLSNAQYFTKVHLSGVELYALRYRFSDTTVINQKAKFRRVSLQEMYSAFTGGIDYYIIHETAGFLSPTEDCGIFESHNHKKFTSVELLKTLNKRLTFFLCAKKQKGGQEILEIREILLYIPKEKDNILHVDDSSFCNETYKELVKDPALLVDYYQGSQMKTAIVEHEPIESLEAFFFTNVKIYGSTLLINYHP